jgi:sugar fermentation stimulation protein A
MTQPGLFWPELVPGTLIRRYKRFLADVRLESGQEVTAHCANSGRMTACCDPGRTVYLSRQDNPRRKLKYTWELIEMPSSLVGVNTMVPNRLVHQSVVSDTVSELVGYQDAIREVKVGKHSRIDLMLSGGDRDRCYVEIKNCTLVENGVARFPDAVTSRGLKHLVELEKLVAKGYRCVMFYLIQRMDARLFRPADDIDPAYGNELRRVVNSGVEMLAYDVFIDLSSIVLRRKVPFEL